MSRAVKLDVGRIHYEDWIYVGATGNDIARAYTQTAVRPDIIQINSKSGLEGSNKNGAYAGSKFGSIGLTQSFAMELVVPVHDLDDGSGRLQEIADGFFLLPIEREGYSRTGHQHAWSQRLDAGDLAGGVRDDLAAH